VVGDVAILESLRTVEDLGCYDVVAVHYDTLAPEEQEALSSVATRGHRPRLLLLSERGADRQFAPLLGSHALTNVLVMDEESGVDVWDLLVTLHKIRRGEIFGLEKYFAWGVETNQLRVSSSTEKGAVLDIIAGYAAGLGIAPRLRASIRTVADEFLSNAIYNAPVDGKGTPRFRRTPRTETVYLEPGEEVEVRYCCDGRRFGISTVDPFGSLAPEQIQDYLARAFQGIGDGVSADSAGAGLGFFQILDSLSHFIVNLEPGRRTEMVGLLDVSGGYRDFARSGKSFNIFVEGGKP
jgi:hypothetical protein